MKIWVPDDAPKAEAKDVLDLGKERELRTLRAKVTALEGHLAEITERKVLAPPLLPRSVVDEEHRTSRCGYHPQVEVSMETNSVTCKACGCELAPMDVLREFANSERVFVAGLEHLRTEKKQLAAEVDGLKKQRSSLRSQVRKKGGDVPDSPNATRPSTREYYRLLTVYTATRNELEKLKAGKA